MASLNPALAALHAQNAPAAHLQRMTQLLALAEREPALQALFLVGSYARGNADRISDLDLVVIAAPGKRQQVLRAARAVLEQAEVLHQFSGTHAADASFCKLVYFDFLSVEVHVFEPTTSFRLKRPHLCVWDPADLLAGYVADGEPIAHADFAAYEHGDAGLIWELVDCIKWLTRGRTTLAKNHLRKLVAAMAGSD